MWNFWASSQQPAAAKQQQAAPAKNIIARSNTSTADITHITSSSQARCRFFTPNSSKSGPANRTPAFCLRGGEPSVTQFWGVFIGASSAREHGTRAAQGTITTVLRLEQTPKSSSLHTPDEIKTGEPRLVLNIQTTDELVHWGSSEPRCVLDVSF